MFLKSMAYLLLILNNIHLLALPVGTVHVAIPSLPRTLIPSNLVDIISFNVAHYIHEPLFHIKNDNGFSSKMLKNWSIKDHGKQYCFELKQNIYFHDRSKITSNDVIYSLQECRKSQSCALFYIDDEIKFKQFSNSKFCVYLKSKRNMFLYSLSDKKLSIIPNPEIHKTTSPSSLTIGAGPYRLTKFDQNELVLERFDLYVRPIPLNKHIVFHIIKDANDLQKQHEKYHFHEINQMVPELSRDQIKNFIKKNNFLKINFPYLNTNIIFMNYKRAIFLDENFRKFLFCLFRKDHFLKTMAISDDVDKATGLISLGMLGHLSPNDLKNEEKDLKNIYRKMSPVKRDLTLITYLDEYKVAQIQKDVNKELKDFPNITIKIKKLQRDEFYNRASQQNFDLVLVVLGTDYTHPLFYVDVLSSGSKTNIGHLNDKKIDSMLASFSGQTKEEINAIGKKIDLYIIQKSYLIPVSYNRGEYYYAPQLYKYELSVLGPYAFDLSNAENIHEKK